MDFEDVRLFLPKYLSPARQSALWDELRQFPDNRTLYTDHACEHEFLQGDGWNGFVVVDFQSGDRKRVTGLVLSNSCDISADNARTLTAKITFVPLLKVGKYLELLRANGQDEQQVASVSDTIRRQRVTTLMYLPAIAGIMEDSIAVFGDVHSHPLDHFRANERTRLFRLNEFGFYLFLFKLSIHFNRMLENVER